MKEIERCERCLCDSAQNFAKSVSFGVRNKRIGITMSMLKKLKLLKLP